MTTSFPSNAQINLLQAQANQFNNNNPSPHQSLVHITPPQIIHQVTQGAIDRLIAALPDYFSDAVLGLGQLNP